MCEQAFKHPELVIKLLLSSSFPAECICFSVCMGQALECIKHKCFLCVYLCSAHVQTLNRRTLFVCVIPPNGGVNKHEFVLSCFLPSRQLLWYTSSTAVLSAKDNKARLDRDMHRIVTLQYVRQLQTSSWHGNVPLKCVNAPSLRCSSFKLLSLA